MPDTLGGPDNGGLPIVSQIYSPVPPEPRPSATFWFSRMHLESFGSQFLRDAPLEPGTREKLSGEIQAVIGKIESDPAYRRRLDSVISSFIPGFEPFSQLELMDSLGSGPRERVKIEILGFLLSCGVLADAGEGLSSEIRDFHDEAGWKLSKRGLNEDLLAVYRKEALRNEGLMKGLLDHYRDGNRGADEVLLLMGFMGPLASQFEMKAVEVVDELLIDRAQAGSSVLDDRLSAIKIESVSWSGPVLDSKEIVPLEPISIEDIGSAYKGGAAYNCGAGHHENGIYAIGCSKRLVILSLAENKVLATLKKPVFKQDFYFGVEEFFPTGNHILMSIQGGLSILDISAPQIRLGDARQIFSFQYDYGRHGFGHVSPDGRRVAAINTFNRGADAVFVLELNEALNVTRKMQIGGLEMEFQDGRASVAFSPDGAILAGGDKNGIYLANLNSDNPSFDVPVLRTLSTVRALAFRSVQDGSVHLYARTDDELIILGLNAEQYNAGKNIAVEEIGRIRTDNRKHFGRFVFGCNDQIVHFFELRSIESLQFDFNIGKVSSYKMNFDFSIDSGSIMRAGDDSLLCLYGSKQRLHRISLKELEARICF